MTFADIYYILPVNYSHEVKDWQGIRKCKMIAVAVSFICLLRPGAAYLNAYDKDLHFECPHEYQSVSHVDSIHNNHMEDRMFDITCSDVADDVTGAKTTCYLTGRENDYDGTEAFQCTGNHYISGMNSHHDNHYEDRVWWYKCCEMQDVHLVDCDFTDWTNAYDGAQNYNVHVGKVMKGVTSVHNNYYEDRRYKYELCSIIRTDGSEIFGK